MNFKKIGAIALFSLFLTACDKATTTQDKTAEVVKVDQGAEDYKAFRAWQNAQEKSINQVIDKTLAELGDKTKDEKVVQESINKALLNHIDVIKQSAAALEIKDEKVNALKEKSLEVITLGAELIQAMEKVAASPTAETHQAFGELQMKLDQLAEEGKALETELMQKYEPKAPKAVEEEAKSEAKGDEIKTEEKTAQ